MYVISVFILSKVKMDTMRVHYEAKNVRFCNNVSNRLAPANSTFTKYERSKVQKGSCSKKID